MNLEQKEFIKLIKNIYDVSDYKWRNSKSSIISKMEEALQKYSIRKFYDGELLRILNNDKIVIPSRSTGLKSRILLPPVEDEPYLIPLLRIHWNFTNNDLDKDVIEKSNSFSLDMIKVDGEIFSIRFDMRSPNTNHDFFHVQINDNVKGFGNLEFISWLPRSRPCIPLTSIFNKSPISLLLLLYGSLYGFENIEREISDINRKYFEDIKDF